MCDRVQMPGFTSIHVLSVSQEAVTSLALNGNGEWLALGCAALGQLLVWEWRSETYVLKQQGHYYDVATLAYSPDGAYIATGADDSKARSLPAKHVSLSPVLPATWIPPSQALHEACDACAGEAVVPRQRLLRGDVSAAHGADHRRRFPSQQRGRRQQQPGRNRARFRLIALPEFSHDDIADAPPVQLRRGRPCRRGARRRPPPQTINDLQTAANTNNVLDGSGSWA